MKVLVLGASGRTGAAVVEQAMAAGHEVTAFVRRSSAYQPPAGVGVAEGDATDADAVSDAVAGHQAVIDTIAGKTPYKATVTLERDAARAVITAMQRHSADRLIVTSSVGVGDSVANCTALTRVLVKTFLRGSTKDKTAMEQEIKNSDVNWTIARPAVLTDDPATGQVRTFQPSSGAKVHKIARGDLAAWLVGQLNDTTHLGRSVTIASS